MARKGRMRNAKELSKQAWKMLKGNKQLMIFPLISGIGVVLVSILFIIPEAIIVAPFWAKGNFDLPTPQLVIMAAIIFLYYFVTYTIIIFSNTALVGATMKLLDGEEVTLNDGVSIAMARMGKIVVFALISATIGFIARRLAHSDDDEEDGNFLLALLGGLLQGAWDVMVFFALPVIVVENVPLKDTFKRSLKLFKETWGEGFLGTLYVGSISFIFMLPLFLLFIAAIVAGFMYKMLWLAGVGAILFVLTVLVYMILNSAVNGVFQASLYRFATKGDAGPYLDTQLVKGAFAPPAE